MHHFNFPPKSQVKLLPRLGHFLVETFLKFLSYKKPKISLRVCGVAIRKIQYFPNYSNFASQGSLRLDAFILLAII